MPASATQFGNPIGKNQSVANRIVDMKVRLETCRRWSTGSAS
jgi:alkylation response protein AidB-like acyl-CoA dehydrogenase